jgi:hypothetical protein
MRAGADHGPLADWKVELEGEQARFAQFALDADFTAHESNQVSADGQAESGPALPVQAVGHLLEWPEYLRQLLFRHADARILDLEAQPQHRRTQRLAQVMPQNIVGVPLVLTVGEVPGQRGVQDRREGENAHEHQQNLGLETKPKENPTFTDSLNEVPPKEFYCPGSILQIAVDTSHPIAFGSCATVPIFFETGPAFKVSGAVKSVAHYANDKPLLSGWILGGKYLDGASAIAEAPMGKGRIISFGFIPMYRGLSEVTYKFLLNAMLYSSSSAGTVSAR